MASTYSSLKIELIGTGEQTSTWGSTTNVNLGTAIEEAITGSADVTFASGPVTLTLTDTNGTQTARNLRLRLTGTSGGAQNLIVPNIEKFYIVQNECADTITVKNSTGTGIAVPAATSVLLFNTGTNVISANTYAPVFLADTLIGDTLDAVDSTFTNAPTISSLTASQVVFSDGTKKLVSKTNAQAVVALGISTGSTGSEIIPAGTTVQRDATPAVGYFRFNTTTGTFEGYNGTAWGPVGGGATGGGGDQVFVENGQIVTTTYAIPSGKNASSVGPITINDGVTVTIPTGSTWLVL
jgi:hypothetical protein